MDCRQVRERILEGKAEGLAVRRHLRQCASCLAFQKQMARMEEMLAEAVPFAVPEPLSQRLLEMVPQAARELRVARQTHGAAIPKATVHRVLYALALLAVPASIWVGYLLWRLALGRFLPEVGDVASLLPLLPTAILYWGGRLFATLGPLREALLFAASILLLGIALEQVRSTQFARPAPEAQSSQMTQE